MRPLDIEAIKKKRKLALNKYEQAKKSLQCPGDPELLPELAQAANDAWLEFKKTDIDFRNIPVMQTMTDAYNY